METERKKGTLLKMSNGNKFLTYVSLHIIETCMVENRPIQIKSLTTNMSKIINPKCIVTAEEVYITGTLDDRVFYSYKPDNNKRLFICMEGV